MNSSIKLIIFDLDGVLVDAKEIHYEALNAALRAVGPQYVIERAEHLSTYDGLPTKEKLRMLTAQKGLPENRHAEVWAEKQRMTREIIGQKIHVNDRIGGILRRLKEEGYCCCVASNSIRDSTRLMIERTGISGLIDFFLSNDDVTHPKPNCEMFLRCMARAGVSPKESLIVEDSHVGRKAAHDACAFICAIEQFSDLTYDRIRGALNQAEKENMTTPHFPKWQGKPINILVPMAGAGSRFEKAGYTFPKPLIEIHGKPMIQLVVENLNIQGNYIFIVQKAHYDKYYLRNLLNLIAPDCKIVCVDSMTEGAACTTLLASEYINNDNHLLIANSDQYVEWDPNQFLYSVTADGIDGGILTFEAVHPKWSYVRLGDDGFVCEVAEKRPISNKATVGVYYWKRGSDYVKYANQMIRKNIRTNNEFYVCPVFNEAIEDAKKIKAVQIQRMWGLGTPEDLENFLRSR